MFVILAVYAAFKRRGFGWESAFFTALLPTSVGVLGPAFLVPVTMAVIFLPLAIFLAGEFDDFPSLVLLFIMVLVMLVTHAFTAIAVVVILSPYLFLKLKKKAKHTIALAAVLLLPFLLLLPWGLPYIHQVAGFLSGPQHLSPLVDYPRLIFNYGYLPAALLVLGSFCLFRRGRWLENGPVLGLAAWLLVMVVYYVGHLGLGGVYERGFLYAGLMMSFVSGVGLSWFIHFHIPGISHHPIFRFFSQNISKIIYILLVLCCLITVVPLRQHAGYYHMIANRDYCVFTWIEEHLGEDYDKAILDPWKATAFTAVTGRKVFSRTTMATSELDRQVYAYLDSGASNSTLLRENGITIVYSPVPVDNPDLIRIGPDIYLWSD
jgi:diacylglycerol kinase